MYSFLLGSSDPEMSRIEYHLATVGYQVQFAKIHGARVKPHQAYKADVPEFPPTHVVECCTVAPMTTLPKIIDHHNPGDPGYDCEPAEYFQGSSLGQVLTLLQRNPVYMDKLVAAADHCLMHAYAGMCPGIDVSDLAHWRLESRAEFQGIDPSVLRKTIELAKDKIASSPKLQINGQTVYDMTAEPVPELPEAAAQMIVSYMAKLPQPTGNKFTFSSTNPELVEFWMNVYAPQTLGLVGIYGVPKRGYAGGYKL